jgi:hypothetical protein
MASMSAGVGPLIGWEEVTIYMKRIEKLLFEASQGQPARGNCPAIWTTNGIAGNRRGF